MTAFGVALAVVAVPLVFALVVVWLRWKVRERRLEGRRARARIARRLELERIARRLRLRVSDK